MRKRDFERRVQLEKERKTVKPPEEEKQHQG
jgi:hypothetical protein